MDPNTDIPSKKEEPRLRRRFFAQELSLAIMLALSMILAAALSYELLRTLWDSTSVSSISGSGGVEPSQNLQFSFLDRPVDLPEIRFVDGDGKGLSLHDFGGRPILLNIWATWCVPCRKEMPSLDRLQAKFDPSQFLVLTLSIDQRGIPAVKQFYQELGLKSLGIFVDQSGAVLGLVGAPGVPTTLFLNGEGQEIGRKIGPAEWDAPEAIALLRKHLRLPASESARDVPE
jgi:thiol-disulfide isomerase/thioredoxin